MRIDYTATKVAPDVDHVALRVTRKGQTVAAFALASLDEFESFIDATLTALHDIVEGRREGSVSESPDVVDAWP